MTGHEYAVEGRPDIQVDWEKQYKNQRHDRLYDTITEFLHDEETDARHVYEEILTVLNAEIEYHKEKLKKAEQVRDLMLGYRHVDFNDSSDRY